MKAAPLLFGALLTLQTLPAPAQTTAQTTTQTTTQFTVNGTVETIAPTEITLKSTAGLIARFALSPNLVVLQNKPATLADIKPNDYVASAAIRGTDHKLHSTELRIFPEALRGTGIGQRPMNDPRGQTMTNATVTGAAITDGSNTIKVTFPGGESEMVVDPGIPVIRIDTVDRSLVKPGSPVRIQGTHDNTTDTVTRITLQ